LVHLFAEADRFQFKNLHVGYKKIEQKLDLIFSAQRPLFKSLSGMAEHWKRVEEEPKAQGAEVACTLLELLANAERRAAQGRYDDAVARLYRAAELFLQGELYKAFGWRLGSPQLEVGDNLSSEARRGLQAEYAPKLGLNDDFNALRHSPLPEHAAVVDSYGKIENHLQKRNASILAHGLRAASGEDFDGFWQALLPVIGVMKDTIPRWPRIDF
jgi:CRISPR-associated protein (TIGR02710 family)